MTSLSKLFTFVWHFAVYQWQTHHSFSISTDIWQIIYRTLALLVTVKVFKSPNLKANTAQPNMLFSRSICIPSIFDSYHFFVISGIYEVHRSNAKFIAVPISSIVCIVLFVSKNLINTSIEMAKHRGNIKQYLFLSLQNISLRHCLIRCCQSNNLWFFRPEQAEQEKENVFFFLKSM